MAGSLVNNRKSLFWLAGLIVAVTAVILLLGLITSAASEDSSFVNTHVEVHQTNLGVNILAIGASG